MNFQSVDLFAGDIMRTCRVWLVVVICAFASCFPTVASALNPRRLPTVQTSKGVYLTAIRPDGSRVFLQRAKLKVGKEGVLTVGDGYVLEPATYVPLDTTRLRVTSRGIVRASYRGGGRCCQLGQLSAGIFERPSLLEATEDGFFLETEESGAPRFGRFREPGFGTLRSPAK
jgi:flagellar basal body rod protein FlgG